MVLTLENRVGCYEKVTNSSNPGTVARSKIFIGKYSSPIVRLWLVCKYFFRDQVKIAE